MQAYILIVLKASLLIDPFWRVKFFELSQNKISLFNKRRHPNLLKFFVTLKNLLKYLRINYNTMFL